ncbi:cupin domain-containing protein [Granulicella sp. dw_53]|uniref:cupin domain-containing protein n=1 Tax=Granulicella sp. dw_53 TaxID=2719792 RepID=UPI001BD39B1F|nr:cupin domain-containing protein [Granulicella sp. dw_53]
MTDKTQTPDTELSSEWLEAFPGERFLIRIPASATNGAYSVTEIVSHPGHSTPIHVHSKEDEYLLVLEGTVRLILGDQTLDVTAGNTMTLPRGIQHAFGNATDTPVRLAMTAMPGGCEEALKMIATIPMDQLDLPALAARFAVTTVAPPFLG